MKKENYQGVSKLEVADYIDKKSKILVRKEDFTEELSRLAKPMMGMLGYYDSKNVNFSVDGYDFVYITFDGDLAYVKIKSDEANVNPSPESWKEGDDLENQILGAGFVLNQSEEFRSALYRQLNK